MASPARGGFSPVALFQTLTGKRARPNTPTTSPDAQLVPGTDQAPRGDNQEELPAAFKAVIRGQQQQIDQLVTRVGGLETEVAVLRDKNRTLTAEKASLQNANAQLQESNEKLRDIAEQTEVDNRKARGDRLRLKGVSRQTSERQIKQTLIRVCELEGEFLVKRLPGEGSTPPVKLTFNTKEDRTRVLQLQGKLARELRWTIDQDLTLAQQQERKDNWPLFERLKARKIWVSWKGGLPYVWDGTQAVAAAEWEQLHPQGEAQRASSSSAPRGDQFSGPGASSSGSGRGSRGRGGGHGSRGGRRGGRGGRGTHHSSPRRGRSPAPRSANGGNLFSHLNPDSRGEGSVPPPQGGARRPQSGRSPSPRAPAATGTAPATGAPSSSTAATSGRGNGGQQPQLPGPPPAPAREASPARSDTAAAAPAAAAAATPPAVAAAAAAGAPPASPAQTQAAA